MKAVGEENIVQIWTGGGGSEQGNTVYIQQSLRSLAKNYHCLTGGNVSVTSICDRMWHTTSFWTYIEKMTHCRNIICGFSWFLYWENQTSLYFKKIMKLWNIFSAISWPFLGPKIEKFPLYLCSSGAKNPKTKCNLVRSQISKNGWKYLFSLYKFMDHSEVWFSPNRRKKNIISNVGPKTQIFAKDLLFTTFLERS